MKTLFFTLAALGAFALSGCNHPHIEGEVFISTKGGENVKLGRVEVSAFKPDEIAAAVIGVNQKFSPIIGKLEAWSATSDARVNTAENAVTQAITENRNYDDLEKDKNAATDDQSEADLALEYAKGAEKYFDALPQPICSTKTDSDGKYELIIPSNGPVVIVARADRSVADSAEEYFWMVRLDPSKETKCTLSNDNTTDSGARESVVAAEDESGDSEAVDKALRKAEEVTATDDARTKEAQEKARAALYATPSPTTIPQAITESAQVPDESSSQATPSAETTPRLTVEDWKKKAIEQYPQLAVSGSPLNLVFVAKFKAYRGTIYCDSPDWPMRLAKECAEAVKGK